MIKKQNMHKENVFPLATSKQKHICDVKSSVKKGFEDMNHFSLILPVASAQN